MFHRNSFVSHERTLLFSSLEALNLQWFDLINVKPESSHIVISLAKIFAQYCVYAMALFLVLYWFFGDKTQKMIVIKTFLTIAISLTISQVIITLFPHPRPFVMHVGQTLIHHSPTPSFPSHHMIIFSVIAFSFLCAKKYLLGSFLLGIALIVGWARIFVGVHFPMDIMGGFILSLLVVGTISSTLDALIERIAQRLKRR